MGEINGIKKCVREIMRTVIRQGIVHDGETCASRFEDNVELYSLLLDTLSRYGIVKITHANGDVFAPKWLVEELEYIDYHDLPSMTKLKTLKRIIQSFI